MVDMPSKTEYAWLAGMIDADGCVTLNGGRGNSFKRPILVVDNTDTEILDELRRLCGGSITKKKKYKTHHRQAWSWRMYGARKVIDLLHNILPFMRCAIKKARAKMLVEKWLKITNRAGRYSKKEFAVKKRFQEKFMSIGSGRGSQNKA